MTLDSLLAQCNLSKYQLAKQTGIAQSTISDLFSEKTKIENCHFDTAYKIAKTLNITMEQLYLCGEDPLKIFDKHKTPSEDELPLFLRISIGNWYKSKAVRASGFDDHEWDAVLDELSSSINAVENCGAIDSKFAWWLRHRYL